MNGDSSRPLLNYYGGKWNAAKWIISMFPEHGIYVEVFGGGASVMLQKARSNREVINDIDDEIVNLYRVVRDEGNELQRRCRLTPHSRSEYILAHEHCDEPLERARRTIVKSYFGIGDSIFHRNGMRFSKTSNTCVARSWKNWNDALMETIFRFQAVTIEKLNWRECIDKYDSKETLFYLDPPYVQETRSAKHSYRHEFIDVDHLELIDRVQKINGMAILSGYESEIYSTLPWQKRARDFKTQKNTFKTEIVWLCPKTVARSRQIELFHDPE